MINNRQQSGRRRGRGGGGQRNNGGGGRGPESGNRVDNRARGNAPQLLEKYKGLARDAQQAGDRVMTEYYLQFAEHYFRVVSETRNRFEEQRRPQGGEPGVEGQAYEADEFDGDDGDDFFPTIRTQQQREPRQDREARPERADNGRDGERRERFERNDQRPEREARPERGENEFRRDAGQGRVRDDSPGPQRPREEEPRLVAEGEDFEPREEPRRRRELPPRRDRSTGPNGFDASVLPPALGAEPLEEAGEPNDEAEPFGNQAEPELPMAAEQPAPRRRGRPRKDAGAEAPVADA